MVKKRPHRRAALIKAIHLELQKEQAKLCLKELEACIHTSNWTRIYQAVDAIVDTAYWRELGHRSARSLLRLHFRVGGSRAYGIWYAGKYRSTMPDIWKAMTQGHIDPRKIAYIAHVMTIQNLAHWFPCLLNGSLRLGEVRKAALQYEARFIGVFVPLWLPYEWWKEHWAPHDKRRGSGFSTLSRLLAASAAKPATASNEDTTAP